MNKNIIVLFIEENDENPEKMINSFNLENLRETFKNNGLVAKASFISKDPRFLKIKHSIFFFFQKLIKFQFLDEKIQVLIENEDWGVGLNEKGEIGYFPPSYLIK